MKKENSLQNCRDLTKSAALVRDIEDRFAHSYPEEVTKAEECAACGNTMPVGSRGWYTEKYNRKGFIATCSRDCTDSAQYAELEKFDCADLENIPTLRGKKNPLKRSELIAEYKERIIARNQDAFDKMARFRASYQRCRDLE